LGAAALAGTTYPIDRAYTAQLLGFDAPTENSLDSVSDRDFAIEFAAFASILMMHLSRASEELVLWTSSQFSFIDLPDRFCTGSSIMPQKKNPDVPELVRGKTGRVYGHLTALLTLMKSQPLAYNKDNQEDKEPVFDAIDTVKDCLRAFADMIPAIQPRKEKMYEAAKRGFSTATATDDNRSTHKNSTERQAEVMIAMCTFMESASKRFSPRRNWLISKNFRRIVCGHFEFGTQTR
jgi:argininosuccinate lyase